MKKKKLTQTERDIAHLRYYDHSYAFEIAEKLGLTVHQVKYRLRKPIVKEYIRKKEIPKICKHTLDYIDKCLANPLESYVNKIIADSEAQTYQWFDAGKKEYFADHKKQTPAIFKALRIYGVTGDRKSIERDLRKAIAKHVLWLKETRRKMERGIETGEMRFY